MSDLTDWIPNTEKTPFWKLETGEPRVDAVEVILHDGTNQLIRCARCARGMMGMVAKWRPVQGKKVAP